MTIQTPETHLFGHSETYPMGSFGVGEAPPALGLVHSLTSVPFSVDSKLSRLKRMRAGVLEASKMHDVATTRKGFRKIYPVMLTLTYAEGVPWEPCHISDLVRHIRKRIERNGHTAFRYVWVMELTKAGVPHYHMIIWMPKGLTLPKPDKQGWWPYGMTRIEKAKNATSYITKYASKATGDTRFPQGSRIHACGGLDAVDRNKRTFFLSPNWVQMRWPDPAYRPRAFKGGGWWSTETGEWEPSPWIVEFRYGQIFIRPRE